VGGKDTIHTEGIVVRTIPEKEEAGRHDYNVAVFFPDLSDEAREQIAKYILRHGHKVGEPSSSTRR
jgi:uncharacterized protein (DUF433 family)